MKCENCGSFNTRYRSAFNSWICNKCKTVKDDFLHPEAFMRVQVSNWWVNLSYEQKMKIYFQFNRKAN